MVAPFHISQSIWKGSFDNRHLIRFFFAYADEPLDKKDIVLFGVFDPPATREGAGHYCVVALNIKHCCFELLDSWHLPGSESGIRVINRMAKNIKQLWRNGSSERKKKKLDPANIDHFRLHHAVVPQQENPIDCGFFMNELLETYDDLGLDEPKFSLFKSQCETQEIQVISDDDILKSVEAVKVKKDGVHSKSKGVTWAAPKAVDRCVESDDDSFMPPAPKKGLPPRAASHIKATVKSPLVMSDYDDFILHGERTVFTRRKSVEEPLVVSNKRPVALSMRLRMPVYWKGSPDYNHVYKSGDRVLLSPYVINYLVEIEPYHRPVDEDGQEIPRPPFNVKLAAQKFKLYIKENLLAANLIMLPYWNRNHFTLYTMNKYRESLDIHDSWRYTGRNLSRNRFHEEHVEIMSRMSLLMKEVYGEAAYNSSRQPRWEHLAERCSYAKMLEQGVNECGFYMLKAAFLYDGIKLVEEVKKRDPYSAYWKAECLFYVLFHPNNEVRRDQWPGEMADIAKLL
ncbi:uncharacterized protein [Triticum aestivum]|uniref:uncharacterized protein isoform X3 n=1 Tax=Triticum aestivum TaxID=4565 RepID=UPI001D0293A8|nr:uncharacterized protein LOC123109364 isoform X3 [Triticum aestivum]